MLKPVRKLPNLYVAFVSSVFGTKPRALLARLPFPLIFRRMLLGARPEPATVDGRSAYQWKLSIENYLDWRGGRAWRPLRDRFLPASWDYVQALNLLNQGWADLGVCRCVYCATGAPFADEFPRRMCAGAVRVAVASLSTAPLKKPAARAAAGFLKSRAKGGAA